jgi:hypothetical protein
MDKSENLGGKAVHTTTWREAGFLVRYPTSREKWQQRKRGNG